jgi:quinol monooxygenase YgiN
MQLVVIRITVNRKKRRDVLNALHSVEGRLQGNARCSGCDIYTSSSNNGDIRYVERWQTQEALYQHIKSDLFMRILTILELAENKPDIAFYQLIEGKGIELIKKLRENNG